MQDCTLSVLLHHIKHPIPMVGANLGDVSAFTQTRLWRLR